MFSQLSSGLEAVCKILALDNFKLQDEELYLFQRDNLLFGVFGKISDYTKELYIEELPQIAAALPKRRHEYSTGRFFARIALGLAGHAPTGLLTGSSREPLWPADIVGSISHSDTMALVVVAAKSKPFAAVGIDLEERGRVTPVLARDILTSRERRALSIDSQSSLCDPTLFFSAKEAVFKAINPLSKHMIDFSEVEIEFALSGKSFRANYLGVNPDNVLINDGIGVYSILGAHLACIFVLAADLNPSNWTSFGR